MKVPLWWHQNCHRGLPSAPRLPSYLMQSATTLEDDFGNPASRECDDDDETSSFLLEDFSIEMALLPTRCSEYPIQVMIRKESRAASFASDRRSPASTISTP